MNLPSGNFTEDSDWWTCPKCKESYNGVPSFLKHLKTKHRKYYRQVMKKK